MSKYITPITKVYSTFDDAKEFYDKFEGVSIFDDENRLEIADLAQGKRNLIVGEPGVGKSMLLQKFKEHFDINGHTTQLINLRQPNTLEQIDAFVALESDSPKVLLLDALDEVQSSIFPLVIQKIDTISRDNPDLPIYLSSRWIFISRYSKTFPQYRFLAISPFTFSQVREYLLNAKHSEKDIDDLLSRMQSFGHRMLVVQIPRYLFFLEAFLKNKGVDAAAKVSRNELFEYFIYSELEVEDKNLNTDKKTITKRVLEKLALTMEIYQTNVLSKDELMTFFDELKSDLKLAALTQINLEVFFEKSLLKNNEDSIEFGNTEFQEYLAAKEISRFPDPDRAAFGFVVDPDADEIYPTWYNALTFLVDMREDLLEQLVEFSGLYGNQFKVMDEGFLNFLSRVDPRNVPTTLRQKLFKNSIIYHRRTGQWISGQLTSALPGFYDPSLETDLKSWVADAEKEKDANRFVPLGNIAYIVAYLLKHGAVLDSHYWREKLITYAGDDNENGVLQRHALYALEHLGDASVIDKLPSLVGRDELVNRGFLDLCKELDADNPKSVEYFIEATRRNDIHGRYGIFALKKPESIKKFLETFNNDEDFRREFLDDSSIFKDQDHVLVENIKAVQDKDIEELCKEALVKSVNYNIAYGTEHSVFLSDLWKLLKEKDSNFLIEMIDRIHNSPEGKTGLYFAHGFFAQIVDESDVTTFIDHLIGVDERGTAFDVMQRIRFSKRKFAEKIYEAGRAQLAEDYKQWEERLTKPGSGTKARDEEMLREFRTLLEPEPGKYSNSVFDFYNDHREQLEPLMSEDDRKRLDELITGTVFKFVDPVKHDLKIDSDHNGSKTYTANGAVFVFGDALITAKHLGTNVNPFRQHILDYIPFSYNERLSTIFEMVKDIKPAEMQPVIDIYKNRKSDLWRHQPSSFVEAVEQYHVTEAIPILKDFVKEPECDKYARQKALSVIDALAPDPVFLREIFELYKETKDVDIRSLANIANGLLVTSHGDSEAIAWRLKDIVRRAGPYIRPTGGYVHSVGDFEDEIEHGKSFAKPLMDMKYPGHEKEYLDLLDQAMDIWDQGKEFRAYAEYLWGITYSYFDNLKEGRSYQPLQLLETKIETMRGRDGANWLASRMLQLRRLYLGYLGKPRNVSEAIKKYNDARAYDDKKIQNSADLYRHLQNALETDLRRWIEGEGAYDIILGEKVPGTQRRSYEKLVQQTLKPKIEHIMMKRGFDVSVDRESELLDGKKVDFLVRYGFVGPIVVEVKLTSNTDLKGNKIERSASYSSMGRYMDGYGASHGIFMVIDNTRAKNLERIREIFQKIPRVTVQSFDCYKSVTAPKIVKKSKKKVAVKRVVKRSKKKSLK